MPQLSSITSIEINVVDMDDKDPIFTSNLYSGFVKRNSLQVSLSNFFQMLKFDSILNLS